MPQQYRSERCGPLRGRLRVPSDKSISHRAVMLGALADGSTRVRGFLPGADTLATLAAVQAMGVQVSRRAAGEVELTRDGPLRDPAAALDCGNSGTGLRLLTGLLAGQGVAAELTGDASLRRRPMQRIIDPLERMGARLAAAPGGTAPLALGRARLQGIHYASPVASAQVKSCVLLAGLGAAGETRVSEPAPSRDHTERMLRSFGYTVRQDADGVSLHGGGELYAAQIEVPADISSAAFALVAATIVPDSEVLLECVGINPTRTGILDVLRAMGADISLENARELGAEPVADLRVRSAALRGIDVPPALVPLSIDEFPAIAVAAACAEGVTRVTGAAELRVKESDRIASVVAGLRAVGIDSEAFADGFTVAGGRLRAGEVQSAGDHRIAMAFAVAGMIASEPVLIHDCDNVVTSYPGFVEQMTALGARLHVHG